MVDDALLRALVSEYARTTLDRYDVTEMLDRLTDRSRELLHVAGCGVSLVDQAGELRFVSATDGRVARIEEEQVLSGDGPCHEAFTTGEPVVVVDLEREERWGDYTRVAVEHGFRSLSALPMVVDDRRIGAFDLYRDQPGPWERDVIETAQLVADLATGYIVNQGALEDSRTLARQLQQALESRIVIEQAKGILAERHGGDVHGAFETLREHARRTQRKLRDVAQHVVDHRALPRD